MTPAEGQTMPQITTSGGTGDMDSIKVKWDIAERIFASAIGGGMLAATGAILLLFVRIAVAEAGLERNHSDIRTESEASATREAAVITAISELQRQQTRTAELLASLTSKVESLAENQGRMMDRMP